MIEKEQLKFYLQGKVDVNIEQIFKEMELVPEDLTAMERYLIELEREGWIRKKFCQEHKVFEYHPGNKQFDEGAMCCWPPEPSL